MEHPAFAATFLAVTLAKPSSLVMANAVSRILSIVIISLRAIIPLIPLYLQQTMCPSITLVILVGEEVVCQYVNKLIRILG